MTTTVKAYAAPAADAPLAFTTIQRRAPGEHDVAIDVLFCGICHSDLHQARNEWSDHAHGLSVRAGPRNRRPHRCRRPGVTKFKTGDLVGVGCMVDSDRACDECKAGLEQFCHGLVLTYNGPDKQLGGVTYGGYSDTSSSTKTMS